MPKPSLLETICQFKPFDSIDAGLLTQLSQFIEIKNGSPGINLFHAGDFDADEYYLVQGEVALIAKDGRESIIKSGRDNSLYPIAHLRPRMYTAKAATPIRYFVISRSVLDELQGSLEPSGGDMVVSDMKEHSGVDGHALLYEFQQELDNGRFVLPSLPEVAMRIRKQAEDPDCNLADLATLVNTDPAIAAKMLKTANSVIYRGVNPYKDTLSALSRLGLITTKQLVTSFAVLGLFKSENHYFTDHMHLLWAQNIEVAAYSYILARQLPTLDEEEAMLAGLLHAIGELVILSYAGRFYNLATDESQLSSVSAQLRGEVGAMVLEKWEFSAELVTVARESGNWLRVGGEEFDYCDLVQVATLYASRGRVDPTPMPEIASVPAFQKLALSQDQTDLIIDQAEEQIAEIRRLFSDSS